MIKGLMDHWVPTKECITRFWKTDFEILKNDIDDLKNDINFNNFTFYSKWYTNGVKTNLPYLSNHPDSQNVKTNNKWGKQIIKYLHDNKISVGAMLQLLMYEKSYWGNDMVIGEWDERCIAMDDSICIVADFTKDEYLQRVKELIKEQLAVFPELDYLFFEFEGIRIEMFNKVYTDWAEKNGKPSPEHVSFDPTINKHCEAIGIEPNLFWSNEGRELLSICFKRIFSEIQSTLTELEYQGEVGIVYQLYDYESLIYPDILPNNEWWLLPWAYWTFELPQTPIETINVKKQLSKNLLKDWKDRHYRICYIGDVALGKNGLDSVKEFYDYCIEIGLDGYIGMGNPECSRGLRWLDVDDETVLQARRLYQNMY